MSKTSNHYFYYGDNTHALHQMVKQWQMRFAQKSDEILDMSEHQAPINVEALIQSLQLQPLLSPKRLIIIHGAVSESDAIQERIVNALKITSEATITLFVEEGDRALQSIIGRYLGSIGIVKYFPALNLFKLRTTIEKRLNETDIIIKPDALTALCARLIGDTSRLENELQKLVLIGKTVITLELVDQLIPASPDFKAFALGDAILGNQPRRAWQIIVFELERGTLAMNLLGQLIVHTRRLIAMRQLLDQRVAPNTSQFFRAQKPYTVTMAESVAKRFSVNRLCRYYGRLAMSDLRIKTGDDPLNVLAALVRIA